MSVFLAFVDQPSTSPTVLLDVNTNVSRLLVREFTLGSPEFSGDPLSIGAQDGYRSVKFLIQASTGYPIAASFASSLAQQLIKPRGWLMFQYDSPRKPMFLRYYRTQQEPMDWGEDGAGIFEIPVTLECDPYLYGELVTMSSFTVTNNPSGSAGTNPGFFKFGSILGDAAAPLNAKLTSSVTTAQGRMLATAALDPSQTPTTPTLWQAGSFTQSTDTTSGADATATNGTASTTTFATNTFTTRITGTVPSAPIPGTYRVYLRCLLGASSTYQVGMYGGTSNSLIPIVTTPSPGGSALWFYLDMGLRTFPNGVSGLDTTDISAGSTTDTVFVRAMRLTGAASLKLDCFVLVPVDTAATVDANLMVAQSLTLATGNYARLDGWRPRFSVFNSSDDLISQTYYPVTGDSALWVRPGYTNILHLLSDTYSGTNAQPIGAGDLISTTNTLVCSYYPRYLHLRPDGT